jgi:adenylyl- and sulfurtransferase ThiI
MIIIRHGEIFTKSEPVRKEFIRALTRNVRIALPEASVRAERWRIFVDSKNEKREFRGLLEAMGTLKLRRGGILTHNQEAIRSFDGKTIRLIPVWKWLLLGPEGQKV